MVSYQAGGGRGGAASPRGGWRGTQRVIYAGAA